MQYTAYGPPDEYVASARIVREALRGGGIKHTGSSDGAVSRSMRADRKAGGARGDALDSRSRRGSLNANARGAGGLSQDPDRYARPARVGGLPLRTASAGLSSVAWN